MFCVTAVAMTGRPPRPSRLAKYFIPNETVDSGPPSVRVLCLWNLDGDAFGTRARICSGLRLAGHMRR
jgi:hypothetical protein